MAVATRRPQSQVAAAAATSAAIAHSSGWTGNRAAVAPINPPPSRTRPSTQRSAASRGSASWPRITHSAAWPISPPCA